VTRTAKLFKTGRSQAVRLPKEFRFEGTEVEIKRDPVTGGVLLMPAYKKIEDWDEFFAEVDRLREAGEIPDDFLQREPQGQEERPDPFADWIE
jgi:antitoxin VapB